MDEENKENMTKETPTPTKMQDANPACPWMSAEVDDISAALAKVQSELKQPKFNRMVNYGATRFAYADLNECLSVALPLLSKYGIAITNAEYNGELITILIKGNQWIKSTSKLPNTAKMQDKGSALTYARRYALVALLGMAAEDDDDANIADNTGKMPTAKVTAKKAAPEINAIIKGQIEGCKSVAELTALYNNRPEWHNDETIKSVFTAKKNALKGN